MTKSKVSITCWMIADQAATQRKVRATHATAARASIDGGPYEVIAAHGRLDPYLDVCADAGFVGIECGAG